MNVFQQAVNEARKQTIQQALEQSGWNQVATAEKLGIHRNTLNKLMRRLEIKVSGPIRRRRRIEV